jgi:glutathione S-transferase
MGYLDVRFPEYPWRKNYPNLEIYMNNLGQRESFSSTAPSSQAIKDKIV